MPTKTQKTTTQIVDIARPGSLPPATATTRPVIVSNRVVMQDPMMAPLPAVAAGDSATSADVAEKPTPSTTRITINPLKGDETDAADAEAEPAAEALKTPETSGDASKADDDVVKSDAPAEADTAAGEADAAVGDSGDTPEGDAKIDLEKQEAALEADAKAQDELDQLVEQKTYFLPINASVHRRSRHVFIFGTILILLLAAAWLNIAMDAGFVSIPGLKPLTHLFSN